MMKSLSSLRRAALGIILGLSGLGLCATNVLAIDGGPRLRPIVTVEGDIVRLGDLIEHAGAGADRAVFGAPQPGQSGTISAQRILAAAADHGLRHVDAGTLSSVAVRRAARRVNAEEITAALRQKLMAEHGTGADQEVELNAGQMEAFVETVATGPVVIRSLSLASSGRFEASFSVTGSRALEAQPARVVGSLPDVVRVPVLTRAVLKGDVIRAEDIQVERRRRADVSGETLSDPARYIGHAARRPLARGASLRDGDVQKPEAVERNGIVTIVYEAGGLNLTLRGRALAAGAIGETIQVQNIQSKRTLDALVTGQGRVSVIAGGRDIRAARQAERIQ
jgi:flagellar basal body P-ring formation protein FlgA